VMVKKFVAIYRVQPDDRNHLLISTSEKGYPQIYIRCSAGELFELINGSCRYVEEGVYSEDARKLHCKVAELFRSGRIKYVIFESYTGVKPRFKYKVDPHNIAFNNITGFFNREYMLKLEDRTVIIRTLVRTYGGGYPFGIEVHEEIRKPMQEATNEADELEAVYDALTALIEALRSLDSGDYQGFRESVEKARELLKIVK